MSNNVYVCCKQPDCPNRGAPYFISQEEFWLKKIPCPMCHETMEKTDPDQRGSANGGTS